MPFGRSAKPHIRSQPNLVESAGPATAVAGFSHAIAGQGIIPPSSLLTGAGGQPSPGQAGLQSQSSQGPSSALGPSIDCDSFLSPNLLSPHLRAINQPHFYAASALTANLNTFSHYQNNQNQLVQQPHQLHPLNTGKLHSVSVSDSDARVRRVAHEFVDAVARSQSQRYSQIPPPTPVRPSLSCGTSYEELPKSVCLHQQQHQHQSQQLQEAPVELRRSTRRLFRNILAGSPNLSKAEHNNRAENPPNIYDNTAGLAHRPSQRISNPLTLRTGSSPLSVDQQQSVVDWQPQPPQTQPSPLQNSLHELHQPTSRRVLTNQDTSLYSEDGRAIHPQGQVHIQTHQLASNQHHQAGQVEVAFDSAPRQYQFIPQRHAVTAGNSPINPSLLGTELFCNPETTSQLSHDSPGTDIGLATFSNVHSTATSPAVRYSSHLFPDCPSRPNSLRPISQQAPPSQQQHSQEGQLQGHQHMAPPGAQLHTRRSQEAVKTVKNLRSDLPSGPRPNSRHSHQPSNSMSTVTTAPPQGQHGPQGPQQGQKHNPHQSTPMQDRQQLDGLGEQGRNSPPQPPEDPEKAFKDLLTKYKNVKRLYFDGKAQVEQLNSQVEQLQNAVANQRITQSRTALDDNEYTTRFNRLNGAINNLAFNIRKDWALLPAWLVKYVSSEALTTGKQEMTAVGRAVITRWIVEEIFHACFHPGLDPELSRHLKAIEKNIRRFSYTLNSQEEYDALTSKVVSWRMTTLDGLQDVLQTADSANHRQDFTRKATSNLTAYLFQYLKEPPPSGVDGSASMIVELSVGIAANLPLESRDVAISYPSPRENVQLNLMEIEKVALPPINTRSPESDADEDNGKDSGGEKSSIKERSKARSGMSANLTISSLFSSAPSALVAGSSSSRKGSVVSVSQQTSSSRKPSVASSLTGTDSTTNLDPPPKDSNKVRFAGFFAVEVRGRQVLVKAPVWTMA